MRNRKGRRSSSIPWAVEPASASELRLFLALGLAADQYTADAHSEGSAAFPHQLSRPSHHQYLSPASRHCARQAYLHHTESEQWPPEAVHARCRAQRIDQLSAHDCLTIPSVQAQLAQIHPCEIRRDALHSWVKHHGPHVFVGAFACGDMQHTVTIAVRIGSAGTLPERKQLACSAKRRRTACVAVKWSEPSSIPLSASPHDSGATPRMVRCPRPQPQAQSISCALIRVGGLDRQRRLIPHPLPQHAEHQTARDSPVTSHAPTTSSPADPARPPVP